MLLRRQGDGSFVSSTPGSLEFPRFHMSFSYDIHAGAVFPEKIIIDIIVRPINSTVRKRAVYAFLENKFEYATPMFIMLITKTVNNARNAAL